MFRLLIMLLVIGLQSASATTFAVTRSADTGGSRSEFSKCTMAASADTLMRNGLA